MAVKKKKFDNAGNLLIALKDLTEYCTSGRRYKTQNPYTVPEIVAALKTIALAEDKPIENWMDANDDHLGG